MGAPAFSFRPGDVISHPVMSECEGVSLQKGMNFRIRGVRNVILMSRRKGAPYADRFEDDGRVLIYEGHDAARRRGSPRPKTVDQPALTPRGKPTENSRFFEAARDFAEGRGPAEVVRVYEKIRTGIWVFNGCFRLVHAWIEASGRRKVFKFKLELLTEDKISPPTPDTQLARTRVIPSAVKQAVWKRDKGRCVKCGRTDNLHFDHDYPYSRGGTSFLAENIRLLCARHNLEKGNKIE